MKAILLALGAILAVAAAAVVINADPKDDLLGRNECTWGPSYWCENLKTAKGCNAVTHCIHRYWERMEVPEDNDDVCGICKDMVKQARDQLESNQTQQDLKDVFEGSCRLIYVKPVVKECINLVDQFIPELVESLASQMNPSVVCTVAGLCNNAHIDKLLAEHPTLKGETKSVLLKNDELEPDECTKCYTIAKYMEDKLHQTPRDKMLVQFVNVCGQFGSFSDSCAAIIMTHFNAIYYHLQDNFNADNICHLSGQCSGKYHKHANSTDTVPQVEITPLSSVGMVEVGDDLPCKLCEQLVGHLKDLLVANTTEIEFKEVLLGLCKQTKSFADECKAIVEEYYSQIYEYLTNGLDSNVVCQLTGICPSPGKALQSPMEPLVPIEAAEIGLNIMREEQSRKDEVEEVAIGKEYPKLEAEKMQLPLERLMPYPLLQPESVDGPEACSLCQYLLHFVQETVTNPATEEEVKEFFGKVCTKIPSSIEGECQQFITTYGDAIIALLVQEIDPSKVCTSIRICPSEAILDAWEKIPKQFMLQNARDKPTCPLCLLAVTQIYNSIKDEKTEANIEAALDKLCSHLPRSLIEQCTDFVKSYSKELVEMMLADLTPQEVCDYIHLCNDTKDVGPRPINIAEKDGEILTNEIPEYPLHVLQPTSMLDDGVCIICEFAMQYIDKAIGNRKTRDEIEHAVHSVCNHLPKTVAKECNQFVDEYADALISILAEDVSPKEACSMLGLCKVSMVQIQDSVFECALCRAIISQIDKLLGDSKVDAEIEEVVAKVCKYLPTDKQDKCDKMVKLYGPSIINMLKDHVDSEKMCSKMALCSSNDYFAMTFKNPHESRLSDVTI
ncbi:PREDICTED: proactivator polypeptide isoform X2 [Vollenhovia emeryi]|uniref:proactivator polypeptide isoform X2 n=1 Tax=Vollenhovia emeryi TaxID=411798 RepID=UPI0005F4EB00|nr:PREDICTED: proactivator polypeptide isoform X2 [Vollenhovia emeryi]